MSTVKPAYDRRQGSGWVGHGDKVPGVCLHYPSDSPNQKIARLSTSMCTLQLLVNCPDSIATISETPTFMQCSNHSARSQSVQPTSRKILSIQQAQALSWPQSSTDSFVGLDYQAMPRRVLTGERILRLLYTGREIFQLARHERLAE